MLNITGQKKSLGFTLIEVMLVIVLIGFMASVVQFSVIGSSPEDRLEKESERFLAVFNVAADFALLNNLELGLVVEETGYQFLVFDDQSWQPVADHDALSQYQLPEGMVANIELEDLPIEDPGLIDTLVDVMNDDSLFEGTDIGRDEDKDFREPSADDDADNAENQDEQPDKKEQKRLFPQVYILSGGEINPFRVDFSFDDTRVATDELSYQVSGLYSTPLTLAGPLYSGEPK